MPGATLVRPCPVSCAGGRRGRLLVLTQDSVVLRCDRNTYHRNMARLAVYYHGSRPTARCPTNFQDRSDTSNGVVLIACRLLAAVVLSVPRRVCSVRSPLANLRASFSALR